MGCRNKTSRKRDTQFFLWLCCFFHVLRVAVLAPLRPQRAPVDTRASIQGGTLSSSALPVTSGSHGSLPAAAGWGRRRHPAKVFCCKAKMMKAHKSRPQSCQPMRPTMSLAKTHCPGDAGVAVRVPLAPESHHRRRHLWRCYMAQTFQAGPGPHSAFPINSTQYGPGPILSTPY